MWESRRFWVAFVSPLGCVAYGLGFVVVSHAPPSQLGPMVMAASPSSLLVPFLVRAPRIGSVAYGMGCLVVSLAPPWQPGPMVMAAPLSSLLFPVLRRSLPLRSCAYQCSMSCLTGPLTISYHEDEAGVWCTRGVARLVGIENCERGF